MVEVPGLTLRASLSAVPFVSGPMRCSRFLQDRETFVNFSLFLVKFLFGMRNFESIELPNLVPQLHAHL